MPSGDIPAHRIEVIQEDHQLLVVNRTLAHIQLLHQTPHHSDDFH
jgi:flagellar biogenesis protein FliO